MALTDRVRGVSREYRTQRVLIGEVEGDLSDGSVFSTGSSTPKTLAAWMAIVANLTVLDGINVADYGAAGDGSDDTAAIQAAIDAAVTRRIGVVWLPRTATYYRTTATLEVSDNDLRIVGDGAVIYRDFATGPTIEFSKTGNDAIYRTGVEGIEFRRNTSVSLATSNVAHIKAVAANRFRVKDVYMDRCVEGIELSGGAYIDIQSSYIIGHYGLDTARFGIKASKLASPGTGATALPSYVNTDDIRIFGPLTDGFAYALWILAAEEWNLTDSYFGQGAIHDVLIEQGSDNAAILDVKFNGGYIDQCVKDGVHITGSGVASGDTWNASARTGGDGTADILGVHFNGTHIKGNGYGRDGIHVVDDSAAGRGGTYAQACRRLVVTGGIAVAWLRHGINLQGSVDTVVTGVSVQGNNYSNTLSGSGIVLGAGAVRPTIVGNRIGSGAHGGSGSQVYPVDIVSGCTNYLVTNNDCIGNTNGIRQGTASGTLFNNPSDGTGGMYSTIDESLIGGVIGFARKLAGGAPGFLVRWASGTPANYVQAIGAPTTGAARVVATGSDTNVSLSLEGQGAGIVSLASPAVAAKSLSPTAVALSDGASIALDASLGNVFTLTAAGDRTIAVPTNPTSGQKITIRHKASGSDRTLSLTTGSSGAFRFGTDITGLTITASGLTDYIVCEYNGADSRWDVVEYRKGY